MKKHLLILGFSLGLLSSLHAEESTCTLVPPVGWLQVSQENLSSGVSFLVKGPQQHGLAPSLNLATENFSDTPEKYIEIVQSLHRNKGYSDWKDMGSVKTKAGKARLALFEGPTKWGKVKLMQAFLQKGGTMYVLTATSLEEDFPKYYQDFFRAIRSFEVHEGVSEQEIS